VSSYASVVDQVTPSVVTVHVAKRAQAATTALPFSDPRFRDFFGRDFDPGERGITTGLLDLLRLVRQHAARW